jgi:hypothetical protein
MKAIYLRGHFLVATVGSKSERCGVCVCACCIPKGQTFSTTGCHSKIKRSIRQQQNQAIDLQLVESRTVEYSHSATTNSTTDIYDPRSQIGPTTTVAATRPRFAFLLLADISFFLRNRGDGNSLSESIDIRRSLSQSTLS